MVVVVVVCTVLFMTSLTLGMIPFVALAVYLVWKHYKHSKDIENGRATGNMVNVAALRVPRRRTSVDFTSETSSFNINTLVELTQPPPASGEEEDEEEE